jgi:hypothetical protein
MDHGHKEWVCNSPGLRPHSGYPPSEERGVAHRGDTGEMGVGRDGRVIDLRVPTGREGGRRGGRGKESVGWYCASTSSFREFCPREIRYVSSSPYTMHVWLVGVRGPGIAELCSVASRVARETQPPYLLILVRDCFA